VDWETHPQQSSLVMIHGQLSPPGDGQGYTLLFPLSQDQWSSRLHSCTLTLDHGKKKCGGFLRYKPTLLSLVKAS